jgi:antitoxin component YwqK of YwqJK toxin-antitoxin module
MYTKVYFNNGIIKAEGWIHKNHKTDYWIFYYETGTIASKGNFRNNKKDGYWYFYRPNQSLEKEGHYTNDVAENWWIFYDIAKGNKTNFQYKNNHKNGFALRYKKEKLVLVEKYTNNLKVGEWTSIWAFKRDNPDASF